MKKNLLIVITILITTNLFAQQKYLTKAATISFNSKAKLENIEAKSSTATSIINSNGDVAFSVLVNSFKFRQSLMEEHFNETYMESNKPGLDKASFKGKIDDVSKIDFTKDGSYKVSVKGDLTIHGVKKNVSTTGTITVKSTKINVVCTFSIKLADYKIKIGNKTDNISETVSISVNGDYDKMK